MGGEGSGRNKKPEPVKADALARERLLRVLTRLQVSPEALATCPEITPLLMEAKGGMKQVLAAMRFSQDDVIVTFLNKYHSLPMAERSGVPFEAVALAAGLDIRTLLGSILLALQAQSVSAVKIMALTAHPSITSARIQYGLLPGGHRDREALDTAMGFLPSPKGPTFIGKAIFGSGRNVMDEQGAGNDDDREPPMAAIDSDLDLDKIFPPANAMQERLVPIRQRLLPPEK